MGRAAESRGAGDRHPHHLRHQHPARLCVQQRQREEQGRSGAGSGGSRLEDAHLRPTFLPWASTDTEVPTSTSPPRSLTPLPWWKRSSRPCFQAQFMPASSLTRERPVRGFSPSWTDWPEGEHRGYRDCLLFRARPPRWRSLLSHSARFWRLAQAAGPDKAQRLRYTDLEAAFLKLNSQHVVLILNACRSGGALESSEWRRGPMNSRGLVQVAWEKDMEVIAPSRHTIRIGAQGVGPRPADVFLTEGLGRGARGIAGLTVRDWLDYSSQSASTAAK